MGVKSLAPYVRSTHSLRHMMADVIIALCVLLVIPVVETGPRLAVTAVGTVGVCILSEILFSLIARIPIRVNDLSCVVTGLVIALLMPVNVPQWLPMLAAGFAILVAKAPFGGTGRAPFNPAAAGVAFVTVCFPGQSFQALPLRQFPWWGECQGIPEETAASLLQRGMRPEMGALERIWNVAAGPAGQTALLVLLAAGLYLVIRKTAPWDGMLCCLAGAAAAAFLFPRVVGPRWESVLFELLAGSLVFCAVFLVGEPSTSPHTRLGRCLYGLGIGILAILLRHIGPYEEGVCFAVLLANPFTPVLDRFAWRIRSYKMHHAAKGETV